VNDGDRVVLRSGSGESGRLTVRIGDGLPEGVVFAPLGAPGSPTEGALPADMAPVLVKVARVEAG